MDKSDKQRQYTAIYFPASMIDEREKTWFALQDIDCNFSKLIQVLTKQIFSLAKFILSKDKNFRHFSWFIVIRDNSDEQVYSTEKFETKNIQKIL